MRTTEALVEVEDGMEAAVLAIMRDPKKKPEAKLDIGLKYYKAITSTELQKVATVAQVASLYSTGRREEILKNMLPPMSNVVALDIEFKSRSELRELTDTLDKRNRDIEELTQRCKAAENQLADIKDEKTVIEKPALTKAAQQEYELKRRF